MNNPLQGLIEILRQKEDQKTSDYNHAEADAASDRIVYALKGQASAYKQAWMAVRDFAAEHNIIEPKFKVGQEVWTVFYGKIIKGTVDYFTVFDGQNLKYVIHGELNLEVWGKGLYATESEAQAECDRRNKKE